MKNIIIIFILIGTSFMTYAQNSTLIINSEVKVDSTGNAAFEMSGKLTGQQWNIWNSIYGGGNALMVKKQIERSLSQYYVYDFRYSPNEMERTFTIQYKTKGIVKYLGKDKWLAEMGLKENKPTKIGENSCNFVTSQLAGNTVIQTNGVLTFPPQTKNMTFDKDEFNNIVIKYEMPTESITKLGESGTKNLGYSLLGLSALTLAGLVFFRKKLA